MNINYYHIYFILILIILYLIHNIKEPFIIGGKYTFEEALADSIASDIYLKKFNRRNYLSKSRVQNNIDRVINKTKSYSNLKNGKKVKTLSNEYKRLFLGPDKRLRNRAANAQVLIGQNWRGRRSYENYLKQLINENNNINNSENINKYRKIAELRLENKKAGVLKEFEELSNLEREVNLIKNVRMKKLKQRKEQLEKKKSLSKKETTELSKISTNLSKAGNEINKARKKVFNKKQDLEKAKQKSLKLRQKRKQRR